MKSIQEIAREIPNTKVFSKLDAKSGFMQIQLDEESSKLKTFNTPLGRHRWLRLPFSLKCSPEIFQRIMEQMLEGIKVEIHCDASSTGLAACLTQNGNPVVYSSRALTDAGQRYAQIEKEKAAIVHACKKFHCYVFGNEVTVFTDHKPLEQIFKKQLLSAPMRLQRMLLALQ
ncbi:hypothetical protein PoB_005057500 [Plakobranchus ocellatus]|uniref:Reverse transcriptase RNase H-like domain-containing protein n=1 Tax=Plakobranchus ocellatus TaxID=259542 RepID=A0AAV4BUE6_9GAST|nr:hypothetical protein PoB_005057500 [Plakobranchus ocellatus]